MRITMCSRIDSLLAESLSVLSDVPSKIDGRQLIANLNISIDNINSTLNEFRVHEARELLCRSLESQLSELTALEDEMKR